MYRVIIVMMLATLLAACSSQKDEVSSSKAVVPTSTAMSGHKMGDTDVKMTVKTPNVPFEYGIGMKKFQTMCASCHGQWGGGSEQGPPLMHLFYKPSHHSDRAFYNAALKGVQQHHWKFGNMPAVEGVMPQDVEKIIAFVRWLQRENGIY